ncbi:conserved domain protein [Fibrobacter succinogenes subsp. succinogenes S85]|uniref:Conserved domain protein n=2 Tax=Fibrobacter succinogenes TaxID=833 RepID=C9RKV0_FIBSS|nr:protein of unknown function DUF58 [Fibrobacter succinogenes subsp. succinogenes S85]ADL25271.1 conserved domain protein [Fibrobacter succinogenes subsp. succinogenes S85]
MSLFRFFINAIPRSPKRKGLLMRLYYIWQEGFTQVGHAAATLMLFSMFAGAVPGFWAAWVFCGLDFMYFLALVPCLFMTVRKSKFKTGDISVRNVYEGETLTIDLHVTAEDKLNAVSLGCFRMDPSLKCEESTLVAIAAGEMAKLTCKIQTKKRGAFEIPKVSVIIPEINGALRYAANVGKAELLVFPRPFRVGTFSFLTSGASGVVFAPLLMPSLTRGMDFLGVREYREGDSLRDLHHKAFARYGKPFTKEFETERGAGAILVLDVTARSLREKSAVEMLIRLAAGVGLWLLERKALGRFFIGDDEIALVQGDGGVSFLEALARIPAASWLETRASRNATGAQKLWSPAARPLGPVLRMGLFATEDPLVHKQVILDAHSKLTDESKTAISDDVLSVNAAHLEKAFQERLRRERTISERPLGNSREAEVSL